MIVTDWTRKALAYRKQKRDLEKRGYRMHETDWELNRGSWSWSNSHGANYRIVDAQISVCGKFVYTKVENVA